MEDYLPNLLYLIMALGAVGVFALMPRPDGARVIAGSMLTISALVGLMTLLVLQLLPVDGTRLFGCLFSGMALYGAVRMITHARAVYSALYFVLVIISVAALLIVQQAEFLAFALVIVYAGAILITYIFVIMLANQPGSPMYDRAAREPFAAVLAGFVLVAVISGRVGDVRALAGNVEQARIQQQRAAVLVDDDADAERSLQATAPGSQMAAADMSAATEKTPAEAAVESRLAESNSLAIGVDIMTRYVVVLELAGILLLIAMVGAVALAHKKVPALVQRQAQAPLGQAGRKVKPF